MSYEQGLSNFELELGKLASAAIEDRADDVFLYYQPRGESHVDIAYGVNGQVVRFDRLKTLDVEPRLKLGTLRYMKLILEMAKPSGTFAGTYVDDDPAHDNPYEMKIHYRPSAGEVVASEAWLEPVSTDEHKVKGEALAQAWFDEISAGYPASAEWTRRS